MTKRIERLTLTDIRLDGGTQAREQLDEQKVQKYTQELRDGTEFDEIMVFQEGEVFWLADGFHRVESHTRAGLLEILAEIQPGDARAAFLYNVTKNGHHGLPLNNLDKNRVVERMLRDPVWCEYSNHKIAKICGVSPPFVGKVRRRLAGGEAAPAEEVETVSTPADGEASAEARVDPLVGAHLQGQGVVSLVAAAPPFVPFPEGCDDVDARRERALRLSRPEEVTAALAVPGLQRGLVPALENHRGALEKIGRQSLRGLVSEASPILGWSWPSSEPAPGVVEALVRRLDELADLDNYVLGHLPPDTQLGSLEHQAVTSYDQALELLRQRGLCPEARYLAYRIAYAVKEMGLPDPSNTWRVRRELERKSPPLPHGLAEVARAALEKLEEAEKAAAQKPAEKSVYDKMREIRQKPVEEALEAIAEQPDVEVLTELLESEWRMREQQPERAPVRPAIRERLIALDVEVLTCPNPRCGGCTYPAGKRCTNCYMGQKDALKRWNTQIRDARETLVLAGEAAAAAPMDVPPALQNLLQALYAMLEAGGDDPAYQLPEPVLEALAEWQEDDLPGLDQQLAQQLAACHDDEEEYDDCDEDGYDEDDDEDDDDCDEDDCDEDDDDCDEDEDDDEQLDDGPINNQQIEALIVGEPIAVVASLAGPDDDTDDDGDDDPDGDGNDDTDDDADNDCDDAADTEQDGDGSTRPKPHVWGPGGYCRDNECEAKKGTPSAERACPFLPTADDAFDAWAETPAAARAPAEEPTAAAAADTDADAGGAELVDPLAGADGSSTRRERIAAMSTLAEIAAVEAYYVGRRALSGPVFSAFLAQRRLLEQVQDLVAETPAGDLAAYDLAHQRLDRLWSIEADRRPGVGRAITAALEELRSRLPEDRGEAPAAAAAPADPFPSNGPPTYQAKDREKLIKGYTSLAQVEAVETAVGYLQEQGRPLQKSVTDSLARHRKLLERIAELEANPGALSSAELIDLRNLEETRRPGVSAAAAAAIERRRQRLQPALPFAQEPGEVGSAL